MSCCFIVTQKGIKYFVVMWKSWKQMKQNGLIFPIWLDVRASMKMSQDCITCQWVRFNMYWQPVQKCHHQNIVNFLLTSMPLPLKAFQIFSSKQFPRNSNFIRHKQINPSVKLSYSSNDYGPLPDKIELYTSVEIRLYLHFLQNIIWRLW